MEAEFKYLFLGNTKSSISVSFQILFFVCLGASTNSHSQLVWPENELSLLWRVLQQEFPSAGFTETWPKSYHTLCSDFFGKRAPSIPLVQRGKALCRTIKNQGSLTLSANLGFYPLARSYPVGDSLDNLGNPNSSLIALGVDPELGNVWTKIPPLLQAEVQHRFNKKFFVYLRIKAIKAFDAWHDDKTGFNVPLKEGEIDINEPSLAYLNWRSSFLDLIIGRFPVHWSPSFRYGVTLTSSTPYHDGMMFSLKARRIRYHFLISSINPWLSGTPKGTQEPFPEDSEEYRQRNYGKVYNYRNRVYDTPVKTLFAHRLEFSSTIFEGGITELGLIGGKPPTWRDGNPMVFFHNNYGDGYTNISTGVDAKINIFKRVTLFGEAFFDDIKEADDGGTPTTMGWMAGLQHSFRFKNALFLQECHIIQTNPYLYNHLLPYLKNAGRHVIKSNYIELGSKPFIDTYVMDYPLGYIRGPDALDIRYGVTALVSSYSFSIELGWLQHGEKNIYSLFKREDINSPSGLVEEEFRTLLECHWQVLPHFTLMVGYGLQYRNHVRNRDNRESLHQQVAAAITWNWP